MVEAGSELRVFEFQLRQQLFLNPRGVHLTEECRVIKLLNLDGRNKKYIHERTVTFTHYTVSTQISLGNMVKQEKQKSLVAETGKIL